VNVTMKTPEFTVRGFSPKHPRFVFFQHVDKGLIGILNPPKDIEPNRHGTHASPGATLPASSSMRREAAANR